MNREYAARFLSTWGKTADPATLRTDMAAVADAYEQAMVCRPAACGCDHARRLSVAADILLNAAAS